jgi:hypothetical protein
MIGGGILSIELSRAVMIAIWIGGVPNGGHGHGTGITLVTE